VTEPVYCVIWVYVSLQVLNGSELTHLALHLFGKDSFFQPYLPLQQVDLLRAPSWLIGTTNQIVTQQRDCAYDVLVNVSCPDTVYLRDQLMVD